MRFGLLLATTLPVVLRVYPCASDSVPMPEGSEETSEAPEEVLEQEGEGTQQP